MTASQPSRSDVTLANWREHPFSQWSFQNVREIVPTAEVARMRISETSGQDFAWTSIGLDGSAGRLDAMEHWHRSHTDSVVVLKNGDRIAEWHAPHVDPNDPHIIFSITKSVTGLMAGLASEDGDLDPDAPVRHYVALPSRSAFATAKVRDLLDMTVSLDFDDAYLDASGSFDRYRRAMLWNPERPDARSETLLDVLADLGSQAHPHGTRFHYASPDTDLLGLVIERATGRRWHQFLRDRLWEPAGMTGTACVTVDRIGTARAAGGLCITPYDLARLGQLVMDGGVAADGRRVVGPGWIDDMRRKGNRQAWIDGNFAGMFANGRYRSCWYETGDDRDCFAAVGIHGQWIWGDRANGVVIAKTSSRPVPSDDSETGNEIAMLSQIARAF